MALRDFWDFSQLPGLTTVTGDATATNPLNFSRNDWVYQNGSAAGPLSNTVAPGWINVASTLFQYRLNNNLTTGTTWSSVGIPYFDVSSQSVPQSFIGFRFQYASVLGYLTQLLYLTNSAGTAQVVVPMAGLGLSPATPYYIEVMIDRVNKLVVVWVDGIQKLSSTFDFNGFANGAAVNLYFGQVFSIENSSGTIDGYYRFRDVYFVDNTQDDTICTRLGPVTAVPEAVAAASAPNWVSSDENGALADLNTAIGTSTATQNAPVLTSPASMDVIELTMNAGNVDPRLEVYAMKLSVTAERLSGTSFSMLTEASFNGESIAGNKLAFPTAQAFNWNTPAVLLEKAPDGSVWTPTSLAETQYALTPQSVA